jgi:hypothetical protein
MARVFRLLSKTRDTAPKLHIFLVLMVDEYSHKTKKQASPCDTTARVSPAILP